MPPLDGFESPWQLRIPALGKSDCNPQVLDQRRERKAGASTIQSDIPFIESLSSDVVRMARQDALGFGWVWFNSTTPELTFQPCCWASRLSRSDNKKRVLQKEEEAKFIRPRDLIHQCQATPAPTCTYWQENSAW